MEKSPPNFVVGIGASAGGLDAFKTFFDALPADTGMAFVVISHLHPAAYSQLTEILSRHTRMTVMLAASGMKVSANQVYVIPTNADLSIENLTLRVVIPRIKRNSQVDLFFASVATAMGARAVGIVFRAITVTVLKAAGESRQQEAPPLPRTLLPKSAPCRSAHRRQDVLTSCCHLTKFRPN
jgi:two-component system CheB/CheR fusion protein